jgi:hypothetical protein
MFNFVRHFSIGHLVFQTLRLERSAAYSHLKRTARHVSLLFRVLDSFAVALTRNAAIATPRNFSLGSRAFTKFPKTTSNVLA